MKNVFSALFVSLLVFSGMADGYEINLGPTNPQTIVLQDGTNDLHLVVGTEAILNLEWQTFLTNNALLSAVADIHDYLELVAEPLDSALGQLEITETLFLQMESAFQSLLLFTFDFPLTDAQYEEIISIYDEYYASYDSLLDSLFSELQSSQGIRPLLISVTNSVHDALYLSQDIIDSRQDYGFDEGWRYYDGTLTLSPATTLSGGPGDSSALIPYLNELIVICSGIRTNTVIIAQNSSDILYQLQTYLHYLQSIHNNLSDLLLLHTQIKDRLTRMHFFDVDWSYFHANEIYRNTLLSNLNMLRPTWHYSGLSTLSDGIVDFFLHWDSRKAIGVTNIYNSSGSLLPLVVSNVVFDIAYPVVGITNILDRSGNPEPIWITNAMDQAAVEDLQQDASQSSDLAGLDSLHPSVGTYDDSAIRRHLARFSALSGSTLETDVLLFTGYTMGEVEVSSTYWTMPSWAARFFRNLRTVMQIVWVFTTVGCMLPLIALSAFLAFRITLFGYALLWGGDAVNAGNRLFSTIMSAFGWSVPQ